LFPLSESDNRFRSAKVKVTQCVLYSDTFTLTSIHNNLLATHNETRTNLIHDPYGCANSIWLAVL